MSDPIDPEKLLSPQSSSAPSPEPEPEPPEVLEDANTVALSEALSSSFKVVRFLMLVGLAIFLLSGSFIVKPNQVAVLLRFGKPVGVGAEMVRKPNVYFGWPAPVDEVVRIEVGDSLTVQSSSGWYATTPEMEAAGQEPFPKGYLSPESEGYVLSADGNIFHARATVKYRIADPLRYTFGFSRPRAILTNIVNEALFYAAARVTAEDALYKDKTAYRDLVMARVQQQVDELNLGITLEPGDVETKPPVDVKQAFEDVISAEQERSQLISSARGYYDEITRRAQGEARAVINDGMAQSNRFVQTVGSLAKSFNEMLPEYEKNPWLFRNRLLTARLERVMTNAQEKMFLPELPPGTSREIRLLLSREPQVRKAPARP
jgi:membrane protease subunit HflK